MSGWGASPCRVTFPFKFKVSGSTSLFKVIFWKKEDLQVRSTVTRLSDTERSAVISCHSRGALSCVNTLRWPSSIVTLTSLTTATSVPSPSLICWRRSPLPWKEAPFSDLCRDDMGSLSSKSGCLSFRSATSTRASKRALSLGNTDISTHLP